MQRWLSRILNPLAAVGTFMVMGWGLYSVWSIDFRQNPLLSLLYCALPILSFPLFICIRLLRMSAWPLGAGACAYLAVYSTMNWRSCSALGYCGSIAGTVLLTLKTPPMLAWIASAACGLAGQIANKRVANNGVVNGGAVNSGREVPD